MELERTRGGFMVFYLGKVTNVGKTIINKPSPRKITIFCLVVWLPFPVMGGKHGIVLPTLMIYYVYSISQIVVMNIPLFHYSCDTISDITIFIGSINHVFSPQMGYSSDV